MIESKIQYSSLSSRRKTGCQKQQLDILSGICAQIHFVKSDSGRQLAVSMPQRKSRHQLSSPQRWSSKMIGHRGMLIVLAES